MKTCFCEMIKQQRALSLISSPNHCQRFSPPQISKTPREEFEPAQNLSSGFVEWNCAVVITTKPRRHAKFSFLYPLKMSENQGFPTAFRGYKNLTLAWYGSKLAIILWLLYRTPVNESFWVNCDNNVFSETCILSAYFLNMGEKACEIDDSFHFILSIIPNHWLCIHSEASFQTEQYRVGCRFSFTFDYFFSILLHWSFF